MSKSNKETFTVAEKRQMAEAYLFFGTIRSAEAHTRWKRNTIYKAINYLIDNGDYEHANDLKELIEKNKSEAPRRGGEATAQKRKGYKNNF